MVGPILYPSRLITSNVFQIALSAVIHNAVDGLGRGRALKNETEQARQENLRRMMITTTQNTSIASLHRVPMFPPKQLNARFNGDSRSSSATNPNKHLFNVFRSMRFCSTTGRFQLESLTAHRVHLSCTLIWILSPTPRSPCHGLNHLA